MRRRLPPTVKTRPIAASRGLASKLGDKKRGMLFFKWYGKNIRASVEVPEYHEGFKYIRTIGVSIFNKKSSTREHFGPLRVTLRVLYNVNDFESTPSWAY
jgi:hypothetical protein